MERAFPRKLESLEEIFSFIRVFGLEHKLKDGPLFFMDFTVEEIFTNMVKYNSKSRAEVTISLEHRPGELVLTLVDTDADPFDITRTPDVDVSRGLEERKVGGLGIHLVRQLADSLDYTYVNRQNKIIIKKKIEDADANG